MFHHFNIVHHHRHHHHLIIVITITIIREKKRLGIFGVGKLTGLTCLSWIPVTSLLLLSDPSPIDHWLPLSVTSWLTNFCLVNLIDVTLACEVANSKLVEVVTIADVDAEKRVDDSLFRFSLVKCWCLVEILKLILGRDSADGFYQDLFKNLWYDLEKLLW